MMKEFNELFNSLVLACEKFANPVATKRLRSMQQLVNDILSDFSTVEAAEKAFNFLCDIGRELFKGAQFVQNVKWSEVDL